MIIPPMQDLSVLYRQFHSQLPFDLRYRCFVSACWSQLQVSLSFPAYRIISWMKNRCSWSSELTDGGVQTWTLTRYRWKRTNSNNVFRFSSEIFCLLKSIASFSLLFWDPFFVFFHVKNSEDSFLLAHQIFYAIYPSILSFNHVIVSR